jgi:hypothetical protein
MARILFESEAMNMDVHASAATVARTTAPWAGASSVSNVATSAAACRSNAEFNPDSPARAL